MATILSIEDNVETQIILKMALSDKHKLITSYDLDHASKIISTDTVDLILLDLHLPDGNGMDLLSDLCRFTTIPKIPVIILSATNDLACRVNGLHAGADDFIVKPFDSDDICARIDSVLRRGPTRHSLTQINIGNISLDLIQHTAIAVTNEQITHLSLTPIEFKILITLSNPFGSKFSRDYLKQIIWPDTYISLRNIDTHICKLRKKLEHTHVDIQNRRSHGYYLVIQKVKSIEHPNIFKDNTTLPQSQSSFYFRN